MNVNFIFFLSFSLIFSLGNNNCYSQINQKEQEYKKLKIYLYDGFQYESVNFRRSEQTALTAVKYYINPNGTTDSIIPSNNTAQEIAKYLKAMNKGLIDWNKILPECKSERIALLPVLFGPEDFGFGDSTLKVNNIKPFHYLTNMLSFSQEEKESFKEKIYLLPWTIAVYPVGYEEGGPRKQKSKGEYKHSVKSLF